jgi:tetraacyldisaccharide 4'-kinase
MAIQSWLNKIWYEGAPPPWWLRPASAIYAGVSRLRRIAYARQWRTVVPLSRPVIVVGNLSVGGTGKTPLVCWLAIRLAELGFRPGVVTRGYGGSARGPQLVQASDDPNTVGDEAIVLGRRTRAPVAIGRDRPAAAQLLINAGCDIILSDDGLQHHALARDCEIIVVDGERLFGNGRMLPAGPLRELPARLKTADAVVVNGGPAVIGGHASVAGALRMRLAAISVVSLRYGTHRNLSELAGQSVHAIAAIGNPQRFFDMLRGFGINVIDHPLPDHARLLIGDISFADDLPVLMTEKDAVKCEAVAGPHHWYVPVEAIFEAEDGEVLQAAVTGSIKKRAARA